jgi:hypothetical protein
MRAADVVNATATGLLELVQHDGGADRDDGAHVRHTFGQGV